MCRDLDAFYNHVSTSVTLKYVLYIVAITNRIGFSVYAFDVL